MATYCKERIMEALMMKAVVYGQKYWWAGWAAAALLMLLK